MDEIVKIAKALADPNRIRALMALRDGERCVCEIIAVLGLAPSTVSKHMFLLRNAGLVKSRKQGRWIYFSLPAEEDASIAGHGLKWVIDSMKADENIALDLQRIRNPNRDLLKKVCSKKIGSCAKRIVKGKVKYE